MTADEKISEQFRNKLKMEIVAKNFASTDEACQYWKQRVVADGKEFTAEQERLIKYKLQKLIQNANDESMDDQDARVGESVSSDSDEEEEDEEEDVDDEFDEDIEMGEEGKLNKKLKRTA
uniref:Uncharacterized protein n=1 Tax=Panagrolaimus sp. ES5 TaxID=591445 RepID=A0AC34F449_9BILA